MESTFSKNFKSGKEYTINLVKIEDGILYFKYQDELLYTPLYNKEPNKEFNNEEDTIKVNENPFDPDEKYYTKTRFILKDDLKRIYEYSHQNSKLNISGVFKIKVKQITFKPIRKVYGDNVSQILGQKIFPGIKVDFEFVDKIAQDDFVYLAFTTSPSFKIENDRVIKDIERFKQILLQIYDEKVVDNKIKTILDKDLGKIKLICDDVNSKLNSNDVILTLRSQKDSEKLIYYIVANENAEKMSKYLIDITHVIDTKTDQKISNKVESSSSKAIERFKRAFRNKNLDLEKDRNEINPKYNKEQNEEVIPIQEDEDFDSFSDSEFYGLDEENEERKKGEDDE